MTTKAEPRVLTDGSDEPARRRRRTRRIEDASQFCPCRVDAPENCLDHTLTNRVRSTAESLFQAAGLGTPVVETTIDGNGVLISIRRARAA